MQYLLLFVVQSLSHVQLFLAPWTAAHRLPCPSVSPGVCSNSCPLSQWCHPNISFSIALFSFCPQSFPASGSFSMSWFFTSGGQSIGDSASASVLPMNNQDWFPSELNSLISLQFKGLSESFPIPQFKSISSLALSFLNGPTLTSMYDYWKKHSFDWLELHLLFNILSRLVIDFLSMNKHLLISWLAVIICSDFGAQENKVCHCFHCFPIYLDEVMGLDTITLLNVEF